MEFSEGRGICNLCHGRKHQVVTWMKDGTILTDETVYSVEKAFQRADFYVSRWANNFVKVVHCKTGQESGALRRVLEFHTGELQP